MINKMKIESRIAELDILDSPKKELDVKIENNGINLYIGVEGYGDFSSQDGSGIVIKLELYQGKLQLIVWDDINEQDPTIINLEGAREDNRKENRDFHYNGESKDIFPQKSKK